MLTHRVVYLLLGLCALSLPACQRETAKETSRGGAELSASDRDSISAGIARFDQHVLAQDWAAVTGHYSEDAILLPPNAPEIRGRAAIQKFFEGFPKFTVFKQSVEEIHGDENFAYPQGTYETSFIPPGGKAPLQDKGKVLAVWRKQPNGSWLVTRVIWNSDLPRAKM
jgi:ketosteroid isomerase-like protein